MDIKTAQNPDAPEPQLIGAAKLRYLKNEIELLKVQASEIQRQTAEAVAKQSKTGRIQYIFGFILDRLVFGEAWQRRHFLRLAVQWTPRLWQKFRRRIAGFVRGGDHRHWHEAATELSNAGDLLPWLQQQDISPLRIIVLGAGGIGDVLRTTPILRALKEKVPTAQICLIHTNPHTRAIVHGNPDLFSAGSSPWWTFSQIASAAIEDGVADLVVYFRYTVSYVPSRRLLANQKLFFGEGFFEKAAAAHAPWDQYMYRFPHFINMLCRQANELQLSMFGLMGLTANLPISMQSALQFYMTKKDDEALRQIPNAPFITVHNGAQKSMMAQTENGRITKMLPPQTWNDIAAGLRHDGHMLVQLGEDNEPLIDGVTVDLRGKLTLSETATVLRQALCHVDTEGGLMHLARAVQTRSVILFGPTSAPFFGYPDNINMEPKTCSNCYWIRSDWYARCPRDQQEPECMTGHHAEDVVAAVKTILNDEKKNVRSA